MEVTYYGILPDADYQGIHCELSLHKHILVLRSCIAKTRQFVCCAIRIQAAYRNRFTGL